MSKGQEVVQIQCLNCGTSTDGSYCQNCGQSVRENSDRSIGNLLGEVLGNLFFLDNRFFLSIRYLFLLPGRMTVEFLAGKRKKFISPVTLFLFINLIYFFATILTDYSISLYDQVVDQPYSKWALQALKDKMSHQEVDWEKMVREGLNVSAYGVTYQNMSDTISKTIMIINVPMIAGFVFLLAFVKRRFYYDSLIFAFHFFTLYLASWIMLGWVEGLLSLLSIPDSSLVDEICFYLFLFFIPLLYAIFSIKKFMDIKWSWAIPAGLFIVGSVTLANMFYRGIIFWLTLWAT